MYLKSLTLKGFKSFADRAHMSFEPGLTVIVGPNGSGKSNISDAILWVLGEQSAKQLRGQAMEDVIFSGSSARKPVSVAEVTLVLDNTERLLPVDFNEVAVTRRMYRSGESEYLINNSPCRLMDIQDILHDSGLGKETHSIISQGKLDAILQSRPEERRALVEEAAGISKHKRRKERAAKKIASMDDSITRAKDISKEITRQLRPLERQVERAKKHKVLSARANELARILAVDDLRRLQAKWSAHEASAKEVDAALDLARENMAAKEQELEKLQLMLQEKGLYVGDLGEQRRRVSDVVGRIDADRRLVAEKGRNISARLRDHKNTLNNSEYQRRTVSEELEAARAQLSDAEAKLSVAESDVAELAPAAEGFHKRRNELDAQISEHTRKQREAQRLLDDASLELASVRDTLSNAELEDSMFASRLRELEATAEELENSRADRQAHLDELERQLGEAKQSQEAAKAALSSAEASLAGLRKDESAARQALVEARSELASLQKLDERMADSSPLVSRIAGAMGKKVAGRLGDAIEAPEELENLLELLLENDIDALLFANNEDLAEAGKSVLGQKTSGEALLLSAQAAQAAPVEGAAGERLIDKLTVDADYENAVSALLGRVYLVDSVDEALASPVQGGVEYVTPDGARVRMGGVVRLGTASAEAAGALERKRRIRSLKKSEPKLQESLDKAAAAVAKALEDIEGQRKASSDAAGDIARITGEERSVTAEIGRLGQSIDNARAEHERIAKRREEAAEAVRAAKPKVQELEVERAKQREALSSIAQLLAEANDELERVRRDDSEAAGKLADAQVRQAQARERKRSLNNRVPELERRLNGSERRIREAQQASESLRLLQRRIDPMTSRYDALLEAARDWAARLRDRASLEEADSASLKQTIEQARAEVAKAKEQVEAQQQAQNDAAVTKAKLEVQVEQAVAAITADGQTVLEEALELPAPEDRAASQRELDELTRKIQNLGPVNQVAMEEYDTLKERADYIDAQLQDLEAARKALTKITNAIDRKMKNAFLLTFEKVDQNFREIFAMLFPGGNAHLEMTDPEQPATTGIEVVAQPRGKRIAKMMLMSGGEKSLTALALLFAVYRTRTVPFYVLDEVEAALDDANLSKLIGAIDVLRSTTQLLVISHQRRTMEDADVLYGVSMQADGVSRVVSQRLDRATGKVVNA